MTTLAELDERGITNSTRFLELCEKYDEQRKSYSSNSGEIKSAADITRHFEKALERDEFEKDAGYVAKALGWN
ncbi:MAG: hypothetical protein ACR2HF_00390 [Methylococcaceae bacterium]